MKRRKIDVLCLQETSRKGNRRRPPTLLLWSGEQNRWRTEKPDGREIGDGLQLFYYGVENRIDGVAVAVAGTPEEHVLSLSLVSNRETSTFMLVKTEKDLREITEKEALK
ncbi:hypothetical protein ANCCEY_08167 [Ancylostoma ceylanicum]|uniref:Endonuclease/exonuclease/phosphatase domain-containing protein n=1 Tax=Ancylostoma ceylanicum TaxID=53326 RepID=A0A0D6LL07_9BILA|nr:hypothetical protein ANCCEY_08167 [Ancylostoma ceylanicum]